MSTPHVRDLKTAPGNAAFSWQRGQFFAYIVWSVEKLKMTPLRAKSETISTKTEK